MKTIFYFIVLLSITLNAQIYEPEDSVICLEKFRLAEEENLRQQPMGDIITAVGKSFIGTEYVGFAIEKGEFEQLVINLRGLDCTSFLENCLVLARCIKLGKNDFETYKEQLRFIRYRNGHIDGYPSRLHYTSDWIWNNEAKNVVIDVTLELGGSPFYPEVSFMSENPQLYKRLKENPDYVEIIKAQEDAINERDYYYIPQDEIHVVESELQNGDLIGCTTSIDGLDIGHVGIAVKMDDGRIHFMHAPLAGSKVQISKKPLPDYIKSIKKHTGIVVFRAQDPTDKRLD